MTTVNDPLPPKVDPESLALRAQPRPVKRLNRKVLMIAAGGVSLGLLGVTVWSLQPVKRQAADAPVELHNVERVSRAESVDALPESYNEMPATALPPGVPVLGDPLPGDLAKPMLDAQRAGTYTPTYQGGSPAAAGGHYGSSREDIAKSALFFRSSQSGQTRPASEATPIGAVTGQGSDVPAGALAASGQPVDATAAQNLQDRKQAFVDKPESRESVNPSSLKIPTSPYQVMAGTVIPAALVTGLKSDLPGQVIVATTSWSMTRLRDVIS